QLYESSSARVRIDGNLSDQTATREGVRQGCVLSPMLFNIYSEFVMRQTLVFSILLYASESWTVKKADRARIDAFEMWTWRRMLRVPYTVHRTNVSILDELGNPKRLSSIVSTGMLTFFGHIHRSDNMKKVVVQGHAPSGRRRGRSPTRWVDTTKQLLDMNIAIPNDVNIQNTYAGKISKYRDLAMEIKRLWKQNQVTIVPLIMSVSGLTPNTFTKHLQQLGLDEKLHKAFQKSNSEDL
ncbi:unnamed protein product, partial [Callosobruchus maculatus]